MKKITLIILFMLIQLSHPGVFGSDGSGEEQELTGGFYKIKYKGEGKNKEWVYLFEDKKMEELYKDFLRDVENGVPFNDELKDTISETLNAGINHQLETLKGCMGADYAKKIEDKVKTGEIDLRFDDSYGIHNGYHQEKTVYKKENITLSGSYLEKIIKDITSSIKNNEKWRPDYIYTLPFYKDFLTDIGHEMIHTHAGIGGGKMAECLAHCFTRQCLNSNHDPRDFQYSVYSSAITNPLDCNQLDFPPEIENKMGEGKCFCGVNWEDRSDKKPCKDDDKTKQPPPPTQDHGSTSSGTTRTVKAYLPDIPDDHYSYADFIGFSGDEINLNAEGNFSVAALNDMLCYTYYPDVLIYNKYGDPLMGNLLKRFMPENFFDDYSHDYFSNNHKILVIPSAALLGDSGSEIIKQAITRFVEGGGSVVVFSQQFGKDFKNLIPMPESEIGPIFGFREDSSCLKNSVYFSDTHFILSSSTTGILDVGVDGYFTVNSNSNATVLLKRKINDEPALLYYKYGQGTVFLASLFTENSFSRGMASTQEIKLVKNLLRFALDPEAGIPIFNLDETPNPSLDLNIRVTNHSGNTAAKARISVYTIENTLVYETEAPVTLNREESAEIPITFTLPALESKDWGIGFTVYELNDAEGNLIQLKTETPSGRFSIYKLITPADINGGLHEFLTVADEIVYWGQELECTIHLKNGTDQTRHLEFENPYFLIGHGSTPIPLDSFSVNLAPDESYDHVVYLPTSRLNQDYNGMVTFQIRYHTPDGDTKRFGAKKGVFLKKSWLTSSITVDTPNRMAPGGPFNYTAAANTDAPLAGETFIKLLLLKHDASTGNFTEIKTLFQDNHDFSIDHAYQYTGTYTPVPVHPAGLYYLQLEITAPNGLNERSPLEQIYYSQSGFNASPGPVTKEGSTEPERWLIPGETYSIPVSLDNSSLINDYHVTNGTYILRLISETNREIYRREITGINLAAGESRERVETFVFNPGETGRFTLEFESFDETSYGKPSFLKSQVFWYYTAIGLEPDNPAYNYMDTANIGVRIDGLGSYLVHLTCPEAGGDETQSVQVPIGNFQTSELFQVPIVTIVPGVFSPAYHVQVRIPGILKKMFCFLVEKIGSLYYNILVFKLSVWFTFKWVQSV